MRRGQRPFLRSATAIVRTILRWRLQPAQTCSAILLSVLICSFQKPMTFVTRSSWPLVFFYISFFSSNLHLGLGQSFMIDLGLTCIERSSLNIAFPVSRAPCRRPTSMLPRGSTQLRQRRGSSQRKVRSPRSPTQQRRRDGRPNHHRASAASVCADGVETRCGHHVIQKT